MTEQEFKEYISKVLETISVEEIGNKIEVPIILVKRWVSGVSCPLPRARKLIVDIIEEELKNK